MTTGNPATIPRNATLTPQQVAFFETFGFLALRGWFADDIDAIRTAFDEIFATEPDPGVLDPDNPFHEVEDPSLADRPRLLIPGFIDRSPVLAALRTDPRITGIAAALLGEGYEYAESDGNVFNCNLHWHLDAYAAPIDHDHIKLYFYLDPLTHESGALRVMPGSHARSGGYVDALRGVLAEPARVQDVLGVAPEELPCWTFEPQPGDLLVGDFRTMHASFHGGADRRLFTVNFRRAPA